ncbi:uncharacterized protein [Mobula birostris]|uniref:uncharacterized protein n=1 Tax=Mobula birostris TaxID=1983395 RepID=UPI003B27D5BF
MPDLMTLEAGRSLEPGPSEAGDWELRLGFRLQHRRVLNPFEGRAEETDGDSVICFSYTEGARPFPAEDRGLLSGLVPCCWETGAAPQRLPIDLRSSHRSPVQSEWLKSKGKQGTKLLASTETYDCVPLHGSNSIIDFTDDTTVVGLIRGDDETGYRDEVQHMASWCADNNLALNTQETKEIIVDSRHAKSHTHIPIYINGTVMDRVSSLKLLGVHISEDLTWSLNSAILMKKAQQRLYFLWSIKKAHLCPRILMDFYHCTIESIITECILVSYGSCTVSDRKALQRVVKTAQRIIGTQLLTVENIYHKRCLGRVKSIIKDASHPNYGLFTLLPSGRRSRSLHSRTSRHRKTFFPEAVTLLNLSSQR